MKDALRGSQTRFTEEEGYRILNDTFNSLAEEREAEKKQAELDFLAENSKKPGITITASGLQYEVIREGSGLKPDAFDTVRVH
jgi:FKBP-type peptidyl-prolyl cis-trans isomerase